MKSAIRAFSGALCYPFTHLADFLSGDAGRELYGRWKGAVLHLAPEGRIAERNDGRDKLRLPDKADLRKNSGGGWRRHRGHLVMGCPETG